MTTFSFDSIIASRGYHVGITWVSRLQRYKHAEVGEQVKVELETKSIADDPYSCAITAKHYLLDGKPLVIFHAKSPDMFTSLSKKKKVKFMEL